MPHSLPSTARAPGARRRALIVEDEETYRVILSTLLAQLDYDTVEVDNGHDAIAQFSPRRFDLVLMDLVMPGMDGFRATKLIKSLCRDYFVPVLVITGSNDEETFTRCIDNGGDDVLHKPFDLHVLRSKIRAFQRIRDLHDELGTLYFQLKKDEDATDRLYKHAMATTSTLPSGIAFDTRAAGRFNGDLLLHERGPSGELHILLGDFAGRGPSTAMATLPTVELFRSMVSKGFKPRDITQQLNNKLVTLLPDQMFLAAAYIHFPLEHGTINIINCGLPEIVVFDTLEGTVTQRVGSSYLPLGLQIAGGDAFIPERTIVSNAGGLFVCTDGLLTALQKNNSEPPERLIFEALDAQSPFALNVRLLNRIGDNTHIDEDLSLLSLRYADVVPTVAATTTSPRRASRSKPIGATDSEQQSNTLKYGMHMNGMTIRRLDPIPLLVHPMHDFPELSEQLSNIYTILTELFVNALDHGVLGLDSSIKAEEDGFARYFQLRDERLAALQSGFVDVQIDATFDNMQGEIVITTTDSGAGFDHAHVTNESNENEYASGRGIRLLKTLCASVDYRGSGNEVRAVYRW